MLRAAVLDEMSQKDPAETLEIESTTGLKNNLVRKTFSILRAFRNSDEWLTSQELSKRVEMPKASCHRLVQTLEEVGAIIRGPHGRYRLGMLLVSLSKKVAFKELLCEIGTPILNDLAVRLDRTIHLGVLENGMVYYVTKVSTPTALQSHAKAGYQLEAYCSGLGKVLLAALQEEQLDSFILDGDLVPLTPNTIVDRAVLRIELQNVRQLGFAIDNGEARPGACCVAVPLHDPDGNVVAAISAFGDDSSVTALTIPSIRDALFETAAIFSGRLYPSS